MKQKLINAEFCLILNLLGTFFLLLSFKSSPFIFWGMLTVIDLSMLLFFDEVYLWKNRKSLLREPSAKRLRIYLVALVIAYIILLIKNIELLLLIIFNLVIILCVDFLLDLSKKSRK